MIIEKHLPQSLNADSDERYLTPIEALAIQNCRVAKSIDGKDNRIENIPSTLLLENTLLPTGSNVCIGSCVDTHSNRIFFANVNENQDNNGIYCYDTNLKQFFTILLESDVVGGLGFDINNQINREMLVVGDLLFWTSGNGDPRCIRISGTLQDLSITLQSHTTSYTYSLSGRPVAGQVISFGAKDSANVEMNFSYTVSTSDTISYVLSVISSRLNMGAFPASVSSNTITISPTTLQTFNYIDLTCTSVFNTSGDLYDLPLDYTDTTIIKEAPIYILSVQKGYDSASGASLIEDRAFQFCYFYTFKDGTNSALSAWSALMNYNTNVNTAPSSGTGIGHQYIDQNNVIYINVSFAEKIANEVAVINICVRDIDSQKVSIVKKFDKSVASDLTRIEEHNSGSTQLSYSFYNNDSTYTLDDETANNNFDNVPLRGKTIEIAKNRLFVANILSGYSTPLNTSLSASLHHSVWDVTNTSFKMGGKYKLCINFFDRYRRKCGIVTADPAVLNIPFYDSGVTSLPYIGQWNLSNANALNEIPDWAYYYQIGITKDLKYSFFWEAENNNVSIAYVTKNTDGTFSYSHTYSTNAYAAALWIDLNGTSNPYAGDAYHVGEYVYKDGDKADLYFTNPATYVNVDVLATDNASALGMNGEQGYWIHFSVYPLKSISSSNSYVLVSIYTPYTQSDNEPFYETGEVMAINNPSTANRSYSLLSDNIAGDTYCFYTNTATFIMTYLQCMSPYINKWLNWNRDIGWTNIVDNIGQQQLSSSIVFSDTFIQGSKIVGLNKFQATNIQAVDQRSGDIQSLRLVNKIAQELGTVMVCICENEPLSIYLGETQIIQQTGDAYVGQANGVIGTINPLRGNYGTKNPESVIDYLGNLYWFDIQHGSWIEYSDNGTQRINVDLDSYFKKFGERYIGQGLSKKIISAIDPVRGQLISVMPSSEDADYPYVLPSYETIPDYATTIKSQFNMYDGEQKMLFFDFRQNKWKYTIGIIPEWTEVFGNMTFGFLGGQLYQFESGDGFNSFFGTQLPARIAIVVNANPDTIKTLFNISVEGNKIPDYTVAYVDYDFEQITDLIAGDYEAIEGVQFASFFRDRLSPNALGTPEQKMYTGDYMQGAVPKVMLEFRQYTDRLKLNFINIGYDLSRGMQNIIKQS